MAALSDADRHICARRTVYKNFVEAAITANLTYDDIKAAADAADAWADANAAAFNTALPVPFRTTATTAQKTVLLAIVILKRAGFDL